MPIPKPPPRGDNPSPRALVSRRHTSDRFGWDRDVGFIRARGAGRDASPKRALRRTGGVGLEEGGGAESAAAAAAAYDASSASTRSVSAAGDVLLTPSTLPSRETRKYAPKFQRMDTPSHDCLRKRKTGCACAPFTSTFSISENAPPDAGDAGARVGDAPAIASAPSPAPAATGSAKAPPPGRLLGECGPKPRRAANA